jgi:hypothetical protein
MLEAQTQCWRPKHIVRGRNASLDAICCLLFRQQTWSILLSKKQFAAAAANVLLFITGFRAGGVATNFSKQQIGLSQ